jgi:hypothetical protein
LLDPAAPGYSAAMPTCIRDPDAPQPCVASAHDVIVA